ncbi:MAG: [protein-PII] uridylyltransferase [Burkholderiaceae bacterium]|jgi:[protein-PII] uridylyltransferase|nr:[protein-PII] uridylyltransferase [Burkholderiaceae bacterium]
MERAINIDTHALRDSYRARKQALLHNISDPRTRSVRATLRRLSALTDETLRALWRQCGLGDPLALVAVGGYGREELFPYSDIDVLILLPEPPAQGGGGGEHGRNAAARPNPAPTEMIEGFISQCWDAGLEIGSSVRTPDQCLAEAAKDLTVQTALLEVRLIIGSHDLFERLRQRLAASIKPATFYAAKMQEMRYRHQKHEDTPYALEPNCKESPGGLRDLHIILWITRAAGLGQCWDDLARNGLATAFEVRQIKRNQALLSLIRARLHVIAKRREDRLLFDLQSTVAAAFDESPRGDGDAVKTSAALMRRYYWAAKAISQLSEILLLNIAERIEPVHAQATPINARFLLDPNGMIEVTRDDLYRHQPHAILETFLLYEQTIGAKGLSARTLRALYNTRDVANARFRSDPENHRSFMRILMQPRGITHALRLMNKTSVLGRYLWAFRGTVGQMQYDLLHAYTVDQHTLMVLRNMRHFFMAEHAHEYPFCSQLGAGWDKPWVLYLAALFHDIGKGRGGNHSRLGAQEAQRFCRRCSVQAIGAEYGIAAPEARLIEFLVSEHLTMSQVAQKQDLGDPDVIAAFAHRVGNERYLTALYLLTVADIRGTSPHVWSAWKGKLLEDLYRATLRVLGGRMPDPGAEVEARKREALAALTNLAAPADPALPSSPSAPGLSSPLPVPVPVPPPPLRAALWDTLGVSYFMRHDAQEIAWHTLQLSHYVPPKGTPMDRHAAPIVRVRRSPLGEGLQVLVYTPDKNDLFARICSYFDQASLSIQDAKVHTASNGYALDTFQVVATFTPSSERELIRTVETGLAHALTQTGELPPPRRGRLSRRVKSFPVTPQASLAPDDKAQRWLLDISASDRIGLLYGIARVLARHHLNLELAKIMTLGERVEDTFLIDGPELDDPRRQMEIETELVAALTGK